MENGGLRIIDTGFCVGPGKIACRTLSWKKKRFGARAFVLDERILFDTGYAKGYKVSWLYQRLLPAFYNGAKLDVHPEYIFISHFHPDHIAGLEEFPGVPWIYRAEALNATRWKLPPTPKGSIALTNSDFTEPFMETELKCCTIEGLTVVDLPGHARGQMGVVHGDTFLVADAVWSLEALPSWIGLLLQHDKKAYIHTFNEIKKVPLNLLPTHTVEDL